MRRPLFTLLVVILVACAVPAMADTCDNNCEYTASITAQKTGNVSLSWVSKDANFYDWVKIVDFTHPADSGWGLNNQDCADGVNCPALTLAVTKDDVIVIQLCVVPNFAGNDHSCNNPAAVFFSTDKGSNSDGAYHAIAPSGTPGCGSNCITNGGQIWFEDFDSKYWGGDEPDYNDEVVQFAGLTIQLISPSGQAAVPEPASCLLLGSGLVTAFLKRWK